MPFEVELHPDSSAFDILAEEWTTLLGRSANDVFFLTPAYQRAWWRHLGEGELALLTVREGSALLGLAPIFATAQDDGRQALQTVGCADVSDYLDWVTAEGREEEVLVALVDYLAGSDGPGWDVLELCNVHQDSPTLGLLPRLAQAQGWEVETEVQEVCPVIDLPGTWDEYMASLRGKDRHEQRRKTRRAEAMEEIGWYIVGQEHDLEAEVEAFLTLMAKSSTDKAEFLTPAMRAFFHEICRAAFDQGQLQLAFMELAGFKLAAYLNFIYQNRVLVYNSGLDWEADPGFGAGIVLTGYLIERAIEDGRDEFDFLRGDERYKYRFGAQDVTVNRLAIQR